MKKTILVTASFVLLIGILSMKGKQEEDFIGIREMVKYDTVAHQYFRYTSDEITGQLLSIVQLDSTTKKENGISVSIDENRDTTGIGYYKMGATMPLSLSMDKYKNGKTLTVFELLQDKFEMVDAWRSKYYQSSYELKSDTIYLSYSFKGKLVFNETYYFGERLKRDVLNQPVFDSLSRIYNNITGAQIYKSNCSSCHKLNSDATGPNLKSAMKKYPDKWLRSWIRNSSALIASGDKNAVAIYNKWHKTAMTAFPLPENEMDKLIGYLKGLK